VKVIGIGALLRSKISDADSGAKAGGSFSGQYRLIGLAEALQAQIWAAMESVGSINPIPVA